MPYTEVRRLTYRERASTSGTASKEIEAAEAPTEEPDTEIEAASPDERISDALSEIQERLRHDLLELIRGRNPDFFVHRVRKGLRAMGYGTDDRALARSSGPGDEGTDGVLRKKRMAQMPPRKQLT